jgi:hypothetical protein
MTKVTVRVIVEDKDSRALGEREFSFDENLPPSLDKLLIAFADSIPRECFRDFDIIQAYYKEKIVGHAEVEV